MNHPRFPRFVWTLNLGLSGVLALAGGCGDDAAGPGATGATTGSGASGAGGGQGGQGGTGATGGQGGMPQTLCTPGATMPCYSGPVGTEGVGICMAGESTCAPDGMSYGICQGEVHPAPKDCATPTIDEACDGSPGPCTNPPLFAGLFGDDQRQEGYAVAVDAAGNIFAMGTSQGLIDFGAGALGPGGAYLVKLDPDGNVLWQKGLNVISRSLSVDAQGSVLLYGLFSGTVDLGGGPLPTDGGKDLYLAKFDADGQHVFSKSFLLQNPQDVADWSAAFGPSGEIVITGDFKGTLDLGAGTLVSAGQEDVFVAKFDGQGAPLWSRGFGDAGDQYGIAVAVDGAGGVVAIGWLGGGTAIDFGGGALTAVGSDMIVAKLDAAGNHVWSKLLGGAGDQAAMGIALDAGGDILLTGVSTGPIDYGGGARQAAAAQYVCGLGKLAPTGDHLWSMAYGCNLNQFVPFGPVVAVDPSGAAAVTGQFRGTTDFGQGNVSSLGSDAFVFKVDAAGAPVWVTTFSSTGYDWGLDVATDFMGNVVLTGIADGDIDLGGGLLAEYGNSDAYLVKMAP